MYTLYHVLISFKLFKEKLLFVYSIRTNIINNYNLKRKQKNVF